MKIEITDERMQVCACDLIIATARRRTNDLWDVSDWPKPLNRNQAITALMVIELLAAGRSNDDPLIVALREELR
jgi:hypothetical protein